MDDATSSPPAAASTSEGCTSVGYLTHWVTRLVMRDVDRELRPLNITAAQLAPLLALSEHGPMLQRDIVKLSAVAQPAMVATLAKLESDSLIERYSDKRDKRAAIIALTSRGQDIVEAARPVLQNANSRALAVFSAEEQQTFIAMIQRLITALDEQVDRPRFTDGDKSK